MEATFHKEFKGMTVDPIGLDELMATRAAMISALQTQITEKDCNFLLSFKEGNPDWALFDESSVANLPAVRWKQMNIKRLVKNNAKHKEQVESLKVVLEQWLGKEYLGPIEN